MRRTLQLDVFFDFICPWCLIGKRQLQHALDMLKASDPDVEVTLYWYGVQLIPQIPEQGLAFADFYLQRLGGQQAVELRQAQVRSAAAAVGLDIDFNQIALMPNTAKAHRMFERALNGSGQQVDQLLERLFAAYFYLGEDLGDNAVLRDIALACGYSASLAYDLEQPEAEFVSANLRSSPAKSTHFKSKRSQAQADPYAGVPYFIIDARLRLAGAQPAEVLYLSMLEALSTQGVTV